MAQINVKGLKPGRYGNTIVYIRCGNMYIRIVPDVVGNPRTPGQVIQREKFTKAQSYVRSMLPLFREGWKEMAVGKSECNAATSYLIKNAFWVDGEEAIFDKTRILHAKGSLKSAPYLGAKAAEGQKIYYGWLNTAGLGNAKADDEFCCVCVVMDEDKKVYCFTKAERADMSFTYQLPKDWMGKKVHVFGFFRSKDGKIVSNDKYLGTMSVK